MDRTESQDPKAGASVLQNGNTVGCNGDGYYENIRHGDHWGGCVWGMERLAFGAARPARGAAGCVWTVERAGEFRRRDAHHSNGLWDGRDLYTVVAAIAGAVEEFFRND